MSTKNSSVITGKGLFEKLTRDYVYHQGIFSIIPPGMKKAYPRYIDIQNSVWPIKHSRHYYASIYTHPVHTAVTSGEHAVRTEAAVRHVGNVCCALRPVHLCIVCCTGAPHIYEAYSSALPLLDGVFVMV